ncbi:MAG: hypothetical protein WA634_13650 [Silvibacterium sp.]
MKADELTAKSFSDYPPQARQLAKQNLALLQDLPLPLAVLMLREISGYDWRFPAERRVVDSQFAWLQSLAAADRTGILRGFAQLAVTKQAVPRDWSRDPERASEAMTAYLWSTGQIDAFRKAADDYAAAWQRAVPESKPPVARLCIVILGRDLDPSREPVFSKLRPHGVFFPNVDDNLAMSAILETVSARAAERPLPYEHWYIDGGEAETFHNPHMTCISWNELQPLRAAILERMQNIIHSPASGPEKLRTALAETAPADLGMADGDDKVMSRFKINVFTEGSGTQIFSTIFAQWAAREALRRAQPSTLLLRFAPRQRQLPMDELLAGLNSANAPDPKGSFIDADMGAFYTWINQQRLSGAAQASFVAWCAESHQAVAIGPTLPRATTAENKLKLRQILAL